jgi:hypothetical protein
MRSVVATRQTRIAEKAKRVGCADHGTQPNPPKGVPPT